MKLQRLWLLLWLFPIRADNEDQEEHTRLYEKQNEERQDPTQAEIITMECHWYMAESSIPNAGWGIYTAKEILHGTHLSLSMDPVLQANDILQYRKIYNSHIHSSSSQSHQFHENNPTLPSWLLQEYYWDYKVTDSRFDAQSIQSILPGIGMLANSHTGLVQASNLGPLHRETVHRNTLSAGAFSDYRNVTFQATVDIPPGHELFVDYGDSWFEEREQNFGNSIPLSQDWEQADDIITSLPTLCSGNITTPFCHDLWKLIRHEIQHAVSPRIIAALPEQLDTVQQIIQSGKGTAHHSLPHLIRSPQWLQQHGICLDHMKVKPSHIPHAGEGAFASRHLPKGTIVAPVPVVHLHRGHLQQFLVDTHDSKAIHWQGHQLLLNYVYGHADSSLLFFPYSPTTNLINHDGQQPNTRLRWSSRQSNPEWMNLTTMELLKENKHAGLMMELVALRDISQGEEITIDYGKKWEQAWNDFVHQWIPPDKANEYTPAHAWRHLDVLPPHNEQRPEKALPTNVMTVCWIDIQTVGKPNQYPPNDNDDNNDTTWTWKSTSTDCLSQTKRCWIYNRQSDATYTVSILMNNQYQMVRNLPRHAIQIVDRPYTSNQYLRKTFRHEAHLPDDMVPENWRDLVPVEEECQYFMAESSIPHAGLGMYSAKALKKDTDIFYSDMVIQVEDIDLNQKLRKWHHNIEEEETEWLLANYYWQAHNTGGAYEARDVQSIVPGLGMLANSHDGLVNALMVRPSLDTNLKRLQDPGAGAVTNYHHLSFTAVGDMDAGSEIFVEYGSDWFLQRAQEMGPVPVSDDFGEADSLLLNFWDIIGGDPTTEMAQELWALMWNTSEPIEDNRVRMALPRDLDKVEHVLDIGTARYSVPNSIRSMKWLKEHGRCMDNIMPKLSTIRHAGKGAFATRRIRQGNVVSPAPLVHLRREDMEVFNSRDVDDPQSRPWFDGHQLILNYCYGHPSSSMVFFPYAPVTNYINHHKEDANVELRWSTLPNHHTDWFKRSVDDIMTESHTGLIMEFVAIRDIEAGEEVFLNYGNKWDDQWHDFVRRWVPTKRGKNYVGPWHYNDITVPALTVDEQATRPYPENILIVCYVGAVNLDQPATRSQYGDRTYEWTYYDDLFQKTTRAYPCDLLERHGRDDDTYQSIHPEKERYTARVYKSEQVEWIVEQMPRRAIEFLDKSYESDMFLRRAFRHDIGLPDHMIPEAWKDLQ